MFQRTDDLRIDTSDPFDPNQQQFRGCFTNKLPQVVLTPAGGPIQCVLPTAPPADKLRTQAAGQNQANPLAHFRVGLDQSLDDLETLSPRPHADAVQGLLALERGGRCLELPFERSQQVAAVVRVSIRLTRRDGLGCDLDLVEVEPECLEAVRGRGIGLQVQSRLHLPTKILDDLENQATIRILEHRK